MRRLFSLLVVAAFAATTSAANAASGAAARDWAQAQIRQVVQVGVLGSHANTFHPEYKLTQGQLAAALARSWHLQNPVPTNVQLPAIEGEAAEGQQLLVSDGEWSVNPVALSYQWQVSADGVNWKLIKGATSNSFWISYNLYAGDQLRVAVTAQASGGTVVTDSQPTAPIVAADPAMPQLPEPAPAPAPDPAPVIAKAPAFTASRTAKPVSIKQLDSALVSYLGLMDAASDFTNVLAQNGLEPPPGTGTEIVARLLNLRYDHPANTDNLEIDPWEPATRAEAAYSFAQLLSMNQDESDWVRQLAQSFALPKLDSWQRRILKTAVSYVGFPYVWGGESATNQVNASGVPSPGGFDCSGFVWKVYKLTSYAGERRLADALRGRTTYVMSGEGGRSSRIYKPQNLKPGDVLFFGNGHKPKPSQVDHAGIYLGDGWMIHSSGEGVTVVPFAGWLSGSFAWARRPLREAGLDR